ncbi:MAG: hypothetical protein FWG05_03215, partial [Kiritimatiellaeota bacterium]|nr:hypothetical protein [Kiritimatiellota bacterium]
ANAVWFNTWNENLSQIFDLNGHDQRVGGIYGGANHPDHLYTYSRITSASPATFTLDVPNGGNCVMENRSYFDGELTVVKTGEGKQILNTTFADNMIRKWIVEDGELIPRWGVYSADIEVRGGWIWVESGYNPTFRFRLDGTEPDKIVVKDGGGLDISRVNIEFVGMPDKHGEYLILDASESGASLMYDDASPTAPFHSVTGLPEDCRLKMSRDKKQVRLIRGDLGTFLIIK